MDVDFWASRVHSDKHLSAVQSVRLNHSDNDWNMEGDDEVRAWFPCPFCYVEIGVPVLCIHLQEEHCFDLKNAVCPICAANLGRDAIGHFTSQHAHSIKRRRKSQKSEFWSNSSSSIPKELSSFMGANQANGRGIMHETAPDPLLSPFLCNAFLLDPKLDQEDQLFRDAAVSTTSDEKSTRSCTLDEDQDDEERRHRSEFIQQLIMSTIF